MKNQIARSIPANSTAVFYEDIKAVVYHYTTLNNLPCTRGFSGNRKYADFNKGFTSEEARDKAIAEWLERLRQKKAYNQKRRAERKAIQHTLTVGDILFTLWGYDQTNVDFYEVVEVKSGKTVVIRQLKSSVIKDGFMCGKTKPLKGQYVGEPFLRRVAIGNRIKIADRQIAFPWDGKIKYCSWYA